MILIYHQIFFHILNQPNIFYMMIQRFGAFQHGMIMELPNLLIRTEVEPYIELIFSLVWVGCLIPKLGMN